MFSIVRKRILLSSSRSYARGLSSDAFVFKGVATSNLTEASFRVPTGSKVSLMGSNEEAKAHIMDLLSGELNASSGQVSFSSNQAIVRFQPSIPRKSQIYSVKSFLEQSMNPSDLENSSNIIPKILENVKLGARVERRTINTLTASQHARLQLAVALLRAPDVLLLDHPTETDVGPLSFDDIQDLKDFVSRFPNTCVVNSTDEDFVNSFTNVVLNVDAQGNVEKLTGSYAAAKKTVENRVRAELSEAMEMKFRSRQAQDSKTAYEKFAAAEAELDTLNEIGFVNTKATDEEYIRLMMLFMAFHPPLLYVLYHCGAFDAIL